MSWRHRKFYHRVVLAGCGNVSWALEMFLSSCMALSAPDQRSEMASIIRRFIDRFYSSSNGYTVHILGLDYAGKTALLYFLHLHELVQSSPTFGFNIETVRVPTTSGRPMRMTGWDVGPGCGGIERILGLILVYAAQSDAIIWVVDSCDRGQLGESAASFGTVMDGLDAEYNKNPNQTKKNRPILILANKQDLLDALPVSSILSAFARVSSGRTISVFPTSLTKDVLSGGIPDAFDWLLFALESQQKSSVFVDAAESQKKLQSLTAAQRASVRPITGVSTLEERLGSWLARAESDSTPEEFLTQFHTISLPTWDHYTHIRIAYVIITTFGRQKGKDMVFSGLEEYIAHPNAQGQTRGRTFHITMTYFWIQIVHFGILNMPTNMHSLPGLALPTVPDPPTAPTSSRATLSPSAFPQFLLMNPHVADPALWSDYYSKNLMMSPLAKAEMVLPDRKPLPNLVIRDAIKGAGGGGGHVILSDKA